MNYLQNNFMECTHALKKKIRIRFEVNVECTYWFFASTNIILTISWCLKITEKVACAASFVNILSGQKINEIKKGKGLF